MVQGIVVPVAQGHGELIRYFEAQTSRLGEANVMRLRGPAAANEAGLACNEGEVRLVGALMFDAAADSWAMGPTPLRSASEGFRRSRQPTD